MVISPGAHYAIKTLDMDAESIVLNPRRRSTITTIVGPMFAGKTSCLLAELRKEVIANRKVVLIKHTMDKRYTDAPVVMTHDSAWMNAIERTTLRRENDSEVLAADVIAIDEGQFFKDIVEACESWANMGIRVIVAACMATGDRKPFGKISELLVKTDDIVHVKAVCVGCYGVAAFTERTRAQGAAPEGSPSSEICVGGADMYAPVCRECYYERSVKRCAPPEPQ